MLRLFGRNEPASSDDASVFVSDGERLLLTPQDISSSQLSREVIDYHRDNNTYRGSRHFFRSQDEEAAQSLVFYDDNNPSDEEDMIVRAQKPKFEESPSASNYGPLSVEHRSAPSPAPSFQPHLSNNQRVYFDHLLSNDNSYSVSSLNFAHQHFARGFPCSSLISQCFSGQSV